MREVPFSIPVSGIVRIDGDLGEVKTRIRREVSSHLPKVDSPREA